MSNKALVLVSLSPLLSDTFNLDDMTMTCHAQPTLAQITERIIARRSSRDRKFHEVNARYSREQKFDLATDISFRGPPNAAERSNRNLNTTPTRTVPPKLRDGSVLPLSSMTFALNKTSTPKRRPQSTFYNLPNKSGFLLDGKRSLPSSPAEGLLLRKYYLQETRRCPTRSSHSLIQSRKRIWRRIWLGSDLPTMEEEDHEVQVETEVISLPEERSFTATKDLRASTHDHLELLHEEEEGYPEPLDLSEFHFPLPPTPTSGLASFANRPVRSNLPPPTSPIPDHSKQPPLEDLIAEEDDSDSCYSEEDLDSYDFEIDNPFSSSSSLTISDESVRTLQDSELDNQQVEIRCDLIAKRAVVSVN